MPRSHQYDILQPPTNQQIARSAPTHRHLPVTCYRPPRSACRIVFGSKHNARRQCTQKLIWSFLSRIFPFSCSILLYPARGFARSVHAYVRSPQNVDTQRRPNPGPRHTKRYKTSHHSLDVVLCLHTYPILIEGHIVTTEVNDANQTLLSEL